VGSLEDEASHEGSRGKTDSGQSPANVAAEAHTSTGSVQWGKDAAANLQRGPGLLNMGGSSSVHRNVSCSTKYHV
jgi:hypothetical protein